MNSKLNPYLNVLLTMPLFSGVESRDDLAWLLNCIDADLKEYRAGEEAVSPGEDLYFAGMVISGTLQAEEDGEIRQIDAGQMIPVPFEAGKAYAVSKARVTAKTGTKVLSMRWMRMPQVCNFNCEHHKKFIQNLWDLMD